MNPKDPAAEAEMEDAAPPAKDDSYSTDGTITLDKAVPEIADAFAGCKVGDTYEVTEDDENQLVLKKTNAEESNEGKTPAEEPEPGAEAMAGSSNPAVANLIAKKRKQ